MTIWPLEYGLATDHDRVDRFVADDHRVVEVVDVEHAEGERGGGHQRVEELDGGLVDDLHEVGLAVDESADGSGVGAVDDVLAVGEAVEERHELTVDGAAEGDRVVVGVDVGALELAAQQHRGVAGDDHVVRLAVDETAGGRAAGDRVDERHAGGETVVGGEGDAVLRVVDALEHPVGVGGGRRGGGVVAHRDAGGAAGDDRASGEDLEVEGRLHEHGRLVGVDLDDAAARGAHARGGAGVVGGGEGDVAGGGERAAVGAELRRRRRSPPRRGPGRG